MEPDVSVRLRELRKVYPQRRRGGGPGLVAVDGVDLDIRRGEVFALLGPNGAGKTTTVEILEGYRRRSGGEVSVLGTDPAHGDRRWRARIGIVLQSNADASELSVREMIHHFAGYYPNPADPDQVIENVGLTEKASAKLRELSGGQRRRVDVALGVVGNPELIFLDEPTTGFDPEARRQFWKLIGGLASGGTTILLTTHYLEEAEALADRVGVIAAGRIREVGAPAELGGRATAMATVTWRGPDGRRSVETPAPATVVTQLAAEFGGEVPELTVTRPTLEDVYLRLIDAAARAPGDAERPSERIGARP